MLDKREKVEKKAINDNSFFVRDLIASVVKNWYWYVISLILCLIGAWYVVQITPSRFQAKALLQINSPATTMDKELRYSDINNTCSQELYVIKSSLLMKEVVKRLDLCTTYLTEGTFQNGDWYTSAPIHLQMVDGIYPDLDMDVHIDKTNYKLKYNDTSLTGKYGDTIDTELGKIVVVKTKSFNTFKMKDLIVRMRNIESTTDRYLGAVNVGVSDEKAGIISISVVDNVDKRAKDIANTLFSVYDSYCIEYNNRMAQNASDFIKERLEFISSDLASIDQNIASYKEQHNFVNIENQTGMALSSRDQYTDELVDINSSLKQTNMLMPMLNASGDSYKLLPTNMVQDPALQSLIAQYNQLVQSRMVYVEKSSERGPVVLELNSQIDALRATIIQSIENYRTSLRIKADNTRQMIARSTSLISSVPKGEKDIQSISRQQKIKEELYLSLLSKREENAINLAMKESYTRVIEYAKGGKIFPQASHIYLLALLLGVVLPSVIIFLRNILDVRIHSKRDITNSCNIPVAAVIPDFRNGERMYVSERDDSRVNEAFRFLGSNINYLMGSKGKNVIMLTSTYSGDGKSFIANNLAASLAQIGKKILLINADMRKHEDYGKKTRYNDGLSVWLSSEDRPCEEIIDRNYQDNGFDLIHNGPIPPNASALLSTDRFEKLVERLRKEYDYVLIDSVPFGIVADAFIIHNVADLIFYVINEKTSDRRMLTDITDFINEGKLKNVSIVMNKYNYSSHYGYYGNYGHYGYGKKNKMNKNTWLMDKISATLGKIKK